MMIQSITSNQRKVMKEYGLDDTNTVNYKAVSYEYNERLMELNEPLENILILTDGEVKVCAESPDGRNLILCYYVQKGVLGDMELLSDEHRISSSVIAITPVQAIAIPYKENKVSLENNPVFMKHLAKDLALKLIESSHRYTASVLESAQQRLARYILESSRNDLFAEVMKDVSMSVGMSYRHMYRIIDQLCKHRILKKEKYGYRILDRERLKRIAAGDKKKA